MSKTIEEYFRDWESNAFGYGYGTGEEYIIPELKKFLLLCHNRPYEHKKLEAELTPPIAWLLINALCEDGIIEYGTSPRFGWLTDEGERLLDFVESRSDEELIAIATDHDEEYRYCYPGICNCEPDKVCNNPFWKHPTR